MTKLIKLDKDNNIKVTKKLEEYLNPDYVYIPLPPKKEDLKKEKIIKKGSLFYHDTFSPVSGKLIKLEDCLLPSGENVKCLVLENDFQEKTEINLAVRKRINNLEKEVLIDSIYKNYLKEKLAKPNIKTLVISGIDDEPYIENETFIGQNKTKQIVETLDALLNLYPNSKAYIALKNTNSEVILALSNLLGTYKNMEIKLVDDLFLIGKEPFLIKYLHIKKDYIFLTLSEVYELYMNIKKRKHVLEKYITISGNGVKEPLIIKTKLGMKVIDIFKRYFLEDLTNCSLYVNGIMQGRQLDINKLIVTKDLDGIIIMKKQKRNMKKCIKCGKCINICPIHSNPLMAYKLGMKVKCINCGLCTYICPSFIPLQKYLSGDKHE